MIKLTCSTFMSSNKSIFFINFLYYVTHIKTFKDSAANYYQNKKKDTKKSLSEKEKQKTRQYGCK